MFGIDGIVRRPRFGGLFCSCFPLNSLKTRIGPVLADAFLEFIHVSFHAGPIIYVKNGVIISDRR